MRAKPEYDNLTQNIQSIFSPRPQNFSVFTQDFFSIKQKENQFEPQNLSFVSYLSSKIKTNFFKILFFSVFSVSSLNTKSIEDQNPDTSSQQTAKSSWSTGKDTRLSRNRPGFNSLLGRETFYDLIALSTQYMVCKLFQCLI